MKAPRVVPRHVAACLHSPVRGERWAIWTWKRDGVGKQQTRVPYQCNSWRCETCRRHEAAVCFARMKQAAEPLDPTGWVLMVLTLDRKGFYSGATPWPDTDAAYAALGKMTRAALGKIGRALGPDVATEERKTKRGTVLRTVRKLGNRWVQVVEAHRSGWPHVNIAVWCPELAAQLRRERSDRMQDPEIANAVALARECWRNKEPVPDAVRELARKATLIGGELRELLESAGWGRESTAEAADNHEAVFGYMVKLAGLHESSVGELAKFTQAPTNAKERFRRLRSGKGFLPPRISNPEVTGCMVRRRLSERGEWQIFGINAPTDHRQIESVNRALRAERALITEEKLIMARDDSSEVKAMPPLRHAFDGKLEPHRETSRRNTERVLERARKLARAG